MRLLQPVGRVVVLDLSGFRQNPLLILRLHGTGKTVGISADVKIFKQEGVHFFYFLQHKLNITADIKLEKVTGN